jgi:hypothetical protein
MRRDLIVALAAATVSSVCAPARVSAQADIAKLAAEQVAAAVAGRNHRGEQEEMLRIEAQVPGFGGFYLAEGEVVALMKPTSGYGPEHVRSALTLAYAARPNTTVRQIMAHAYRAQVRPVDYSLSELIAIQQLITQNSRGMPGWTGVGVDIRRNRVTVYFQDSASMEDGMARIRALGVPQSALLSDLMGPVIVPVCVTTRARIDSLRFNRGARC